MVMRPYTAVVIREGKTVVINIDAPLEKEKPETFEEPPSPGPPSLVSSSESEADEAKGNKVRLPKKKRSVFRRRA